MSLTTKQALEATQILTHFIGKDNEEKYEFGAGVRTQLATRLRKVKKFQDEFTTLNQELIKKYGAPKKDEAGKDTDEVEVSATSEKYKEFRAEQDALLSDDTQFEFVPLDYTAIDNGKNKVPMDIIALMIDVGIITEPAE